MALPSLLGSGLVWSAWKVVTRPVALVGGALLVSGALAASLQPPACPVVPPAASSYRLVLHTKSSPRCYYGSEWNEGDVVMSHDASDGRTITMTTRYDHEDGCTWEAREILTPVGESYRYVYTEHVVDCRVGAEPARACSRVGVVTVVRND